MAIRMRMRWDGVGPDQYDRVRDVVGWERDHPTGGVLHEAWFVGDQLNVCDIWESAEDFETFVAQRLMPGVAQVGVTGQPQVEILPLYSWQLEKPPSDGAVVGEDEVPLDAFRALEARVGWRDVPPIGGISLVAAIDGPVVRAVAVFESEAAAEAFEEQRIAPAAAELGFPEGPAVPNVYHRLHALFDAAGVLSASH